MRRVIGDFCGFLWMYLLYRVYTDQRLYLHPNCDIFLYLSSLNRLLVILLFYYSIIAFNGVADFSICLNLIKFFLLFL